MIEQKPILPWKTTKFTARYERGSDERGIIVVKRDGCGNWKWHYKNEFMGYVFADTLTEALFLIEVDYDKMLMKKENKIKIEREKLVRYPCVPWQVNGGCEL